MKTQKMTIISLLMALHIILSFFYIQVADNLRIYFTFLIAMSVAANYDFKTVILYAILEDLLSFFIYPTGAFFLGYTLTSVCSMSIYYFFLHKEVNLKNVIFAKVSVNVLVNMCLNSLWSYMLYSKGYLYYLTTSIIKNTLLIPVEVILFMLFYKLIKPIISRIND